MAEEKDTEEGLPKVVNDDTPLPPLETNCCAESRPQNVKKRRAFIEV
jgi:hypothetical protein